MDFYKLKDGFGNAHFPAVVKFELKDQEYEIESDVMINRGGYNNDGKLTVLSNQPITTPVEFWAFFQKFTFIRGVGLHISGIHKKTSIGAYQVTVIPIQS
jgi:hypothetical protein